MAIDVPPSYNNNSYVSRTTGEPSPQTKVDGMLKFARHQPKAEPSRDSNIPARFVNEAFANDDDDVACRVDIDIDTDTMQPKSLGKLYINYSSLNTFQSKLMYLQKIMSPMVSC